MLIKVGRRLAECTPLVLTKGRTETGRSTTKKHFECLMTHPNIILGTQLERRMHPQDSRTTIEDFHSGIGKILCHCSATALIDLAQIPCLPDNTVFVEQFSDPRNILGVCFRRHVFAAMPRVLRKADTITELSAIPLLVNVGIRRVQSRGDIRAKRFTVETAGMEISR